MTKKIGIIGGGISGLTAAFLLKNKGFEVCLFEKSSRVGGNIQTVETDGFLIELGPNSFIKSPRLVDLIKSLKLETEVLAANTQAKKRYVLRAGKLRALPMGLAKMAFGDFFSWKAKFRLLQEPFVCSKSSETETVADFFSRRLGAEIVEKAADPFIAGIYAGKPEKLSIKSAFPRLYELEKDYGGLLVGALFAKSEKSDENFPRSFTFKRGAETLTKKLAENLGARVRTNCEVLRVGKGENGKFIIETKDGATIFDAVILASTAETCAKLLEYSELDLSAKLRQIYYPPVAMVFFGIRNENLLQKPDGFGFLIPSSENRKILGTLFNSAVFAERAPDRFHLFTTFVGGARDAEIFEKTDEELFEIVHAELAEILGLKGKSDFRHIKRWKRAIPQYEVGYDKVEAAIENFANKTPGVFFCSNFYRGISVGDCVKNAYQTAGSIEKYLNE